MDPNMYTAAMEDERDALSLYSADQFALQVTPNGNTLLHVAAEFNSFFHGVNDILSKCPSLLRRVNNNGNTPIHVAVARGNAGVVRSLIDFANSAQGGGAAAVREMLRARNHDGDTPLHLAARCLMVWTFFGAIGTLLTKEDPWLDHGPNKARETPLYLYVERGYDDEVLSQMLETCTPPEYGGPSDRTALHAVVIRRKRFPEKSGADSTYLDECLDKLIDKLIEWKKDLIKEPDANGWTPLHYAADNGDIKTVQKLLDKDKSAAYITTNNNEGNTALHTATAKGETKVMEELLSKCPDCWEMVNGKGQNILHIAADWERDEAIKYISKQPWVDGLVDGKDHEGNTPMHVLAQKGKQKLFLLFDGDKKALNNEGSTPYDILLGKTDVSGTFQTDDDVAEIKKQIGRRYWLLQRKFLRGLDEKDQGGKGKMNSREQKERPERGKQNANEDQKGKMADQRGSETLMIVATLIRQKEKEKAAEDMGKMAETHMIVATLISTITFAAGFTIPGGYHGEQGANQGMAVLVREAAFKAFVISNTIALICSTSSVFLYVSASLFNIKGREWEKRAHRYEIAFWLILTAMVAMMLAFSTGVYAVLAHSLGLAIATCVIACSSFIVYAFKLKKHFAEESLSSFWEEFTESLSSSWEEFREDPFDFCRWCFCK